MLKVEAGYSSGSQAGVNQLISKYVLLYLYKEQCDNWSGELFMRLRESHLGVCTHKIISLGSAYTVPPKTKSQCKAYLFLIW